MPAVNERQRDDYTQQNRQGAAADPGDDLAELRQAGQNFLAVGDAAMSRSLSGNSERFNTSLRQGGGQ